MDDDFDISDPIDETSAIDPLQGLDDLDDDLFGNVLKKKVNSKLSAQSNKLESESTVKKDADLDTFDDDDDPLAGLLDDEDEKPKIKTTHSDSTTKALSGDQEEGKISASHNAEMQQKKQNRFLNELPIKTEQEIRKQESQKKQDDDNLNVLGDLGLDDTSGSKNKYTDLTLSPNKGKPTLSPGKSKSFMDGLLGTKTEVKMDKPKKMEFVLDDKYKTSKQEKEDYLFGSYNPSAATAERSTPRRRNFGLGDGTQDGARKTKEDKTRFENKTPAIKSDIAPLSSQKRKSSAADWLLKNDDTVFPENTQKRERDPFGDKGASKKDSKPDWLDFSSGNTISQPSKSTGDKKQSITNHDSNWLQSLQLKQKAEDKQKQLETTKQIADGESKQEEKHKDASSEVKEAVTIQQQAISTQPISTQMITQPINTQVIMPQLQAEMIEQVASLQSLVTKLQMEKDHLAQSLENAQNRHKTELKSAEEISRDKLHTIEEEHRQAERRLKEEFNEKIATLEKLVDELKEGKADMLQVHRKRTEDTDIDHRKEIQRLKELHNRAITSMKEEHEEALSRIRYLKDQEIEAISSTQSNARTIQNLAEQLEARTAELSTLQQNVEEKHESALNERRIFLEMKEKDLRAREQRLTRQHEEEEDEKIRLQQLVLRLETRLQMQAKEKEEDHWESQQDKVKIEIQQKYFLAERRQFEEQLEMEKLQVKRSKDSLLQEQQRLYAEVARQRQDLSEEKNRFDAQQRQWQQSESERIAKKLQDEIKFNTEKQFLQDEKKQLELKQQQLEQELKQLHLGHLTLERDQKAIKTEQLITNNLTLELQRRSKETEELHRDAIREREEAMMELQKAREIEMRNNARISEFTEYLDKIKSKEKELRQLKQLLEEEKTLLQTSKAILLCSNCRLAVGRNFSALYPSLPLPNITNELPYSNTLMNLEEDPNFLMWKVNAEKDKDFLEQEGLFLESLTDVHS